ncbi:CCA tRNA nucleotidyltransferase [Pseudomonadota bacterium]
MKPTSIEIIKLLKKHGHEAYWAGGCVRDMLMGIEPKDFDIVTSAKPDEIEEILEHTIPIGKEFGVILAVQNGHNFEIATFRSDAGYSDGRRPDAVEFTDAEKDAQRRDFTINGIFYDPIEDKIIDYVNGEKDLNARLVRFIGNPQKRIMEDHLRILRAIRFKNQFQFQYGPNTYKSLLQHAPLVVDRVANERIGAEINQMLLSPDPVQAFEDMEDLGVLKVVLPEIQAMKGVAQPHEYHEEGDVWTHTMQALRSLPEDASLTVRWATLLHDVGKPNTFKLRKRIRFDGHTEESTKIARKILSTLRNKKKMIDEVCWLVEHHMMMVPLVDMPDGRKMHWFLNPWFDDLLKVMKADVVGTTPSDFSLYEKIVDIKNKLKKKVPREPKKLLTGDKIMKELNLEPGKKVGELLDELREAQLAGEIKTKKQALEWLKKK